MNISEISRQFESYVEDIEEQLSEVLSGNPDLDSTSADKILGLALSDERLSAECFQDFLHHPKSFSKRVSEKDYSLGFGFYIKHKPCPVSYSFFILSNYEKFYLFSIPIINCRFFHYGT